MLNYLVGSTRPDIVFSVHQCDRFTFDLKLSHEKAVKRIIKYLIKTSDKSIIMRANSDTGLVCYVDADFAGMWTVSEGSDPENCLSRSGCVIQYASCPVLWFSRLQSEIALSTTESEYIALSTAMRDVIPMMHLLKEMSIVFDLEEFKPIVQCKVFEDNNSCISVATSPKLTPRTKHISLKYHHFKRFVTMKIIEILHIDTREQTADIFTKPLDKELFEYLRHKLCGW